jgi:hypothetical protein
MQTRDGRQYANRDDLIVHSGYSRAYLQDLWTAREDNGHPPAHTIDGVMHWDVEQWDTWFAEHRRQRPDDVRPIDRSGDPDEELPPAAQARLLGLDVSAITNYRKKPPKGWPDPVRVDPLDSGRTREYRTRRQLWEYHDSYPAGRSGIAGRPAAQGPDPRIEIAAKAMAAAPGRAPKDLAAELAERHGQSVHTWKRIITQARKQAG